MPDLIKRSQISRALNRQAATIVHNGETYIRKDAALELVRIGPRVEATTVVHGRWMWEGRFKACSECGTYIDWDNTLGANHWRYCPRCGAKMDGGAADGSDA